MMTLDGIIEPIYFLITSISFIILSGIQYKKFGKTFDQLTKETVKAFLVDSKKSKFKI